MKKDPLFDIRNQLNPIADPMFYQRWSPRSLIKTEIPTEHLEKMIDAARWSPSCFNDQPWHFILSTPKTFDQFLNLLLDGNQTWCKNASTIGFVLKRRSFSQNAKENAFASFDTGAAWMSFVLQAYALGYVMHGLGGIKKDLVFKTLSIPLESMDVMCGFVIGKRGPIENLPKDLQLKEKPNARKSRSEIISWDRFTA